MTALNRGPLQHLQRGSSRFGYHRLGSGEPLVLLNGDAMAMSLWPDRLLESLAARFQVILFDYPGIGRSSAADGPCWQIPALATDVQRFLEALIPDRRPIHLLGFSSGGEIALQIAVRQPSWLGGVVVVAADAGGSQFVGDPAVMQRISQAEPEELLGMLFPAGAQQALQAYAAELMGRPQDVPDPAVLAAQEQAWRAWLAEGIWDELPSISNPLLILQGEQDQLVEAENARRLAGRIPGAQLELVAAAGHGLLMQEPTDCADRIIRFLEAAFSGAS